MTIEEFITFALLPENSERNFEFLDGEIIEKFPGSTWNSSLALKIGFEAEIYCRSNDVASYFCTAYGAYRIGDNVFTPNLAYKQTCMSKDYPDSVLPLWAVEVVSPNDKAMYIRKKRQRYLEAGILLWEVYPDEHLIDVYVTGQPPATYGIDATIDVPVIAGLQIEVAKVFR